MEEITFCLDSEDHWTQEEGILKLCDQLKKSSNPCESPEYARLVSLLTAGRASLGRLAARALVLLVSEAVVPLPTALTAALSSVNVSSRAEWLIWTVTELVQMALRSTALGKQAAPPVTEARHPHVLLLRAQPARWRLLAADVERLMVADASAEYRSHALEYVTPFLWAACRRESPSGLRRRLVAALCKLSRLTHTPAPVTRALQMLARLQLAPADIAEELPELCRLCVDFAVEINDGALLRSLAPLSFHCLHLQVTESLCDVTPSVDDVTRLLELGCGGDVEAVLLSDVLADCPALALRDGRLIDVACRLLAGGRCSGGGAALLLPPLLRAVAALPPLATRLEPLLAALTSAAGAGRGRPDGDGSAYWRTVADVSPALARAELLAGTVAGESETQLSWLSHLSSYQTSDTVCDRAALALLVATDSSTPVRCAALSAAVETLRRRHSFASDLLNCIVYRLRDETDPELTLQLLQTLPELAVNKAVVPRLVRLLTGLVSGGGPLSAVGVRLLTSLWRREPRCLPYLLTVLRADSDGALLSGDPALTAARLAAIAHICRHSPESGKDHLAVLSRALSELSAPEWGAACSLALEGIGALCKAEVLDVRTTWRILAPKLRQERRPAVLARYMEFLSLVPTLHVASDEYESFSRDVAAVLWQQVSGKRPPSVVRAALSALSGFRPSTFALSQLPPAARQGLVVPAKLIATPADAAKSPEQLLSYVPGECYTNLLSFLPEPLLEAYGHTLAALVRREVQLIGRGVLYSARERARREGGEPADLSYLEPSSILRAVVNQLKRVADSGAAVPAGRAAAELSACLRPLVADLGQPLPPLSLAFLQQLMSTGDGVAALCAEALARHCSTHASAASLLKWTMSVPTPDSLPAPVTGRLWDLLALVGRGVPPGALLPFLQHHLTATLEAAADDPAAACRLLRGVGAALRDERLPAANRDTIGNVMETTLETVGPEQTEVFAALLACIAELPTSFLERFSSPSLWWSVEKPKLVVAAAVRSHMTCQGDGERPMVWMNEIIDIAGSSGHGDDVAEYVCRALAAAHGHAAGPDWLTELMGQMRAVRSGQVATDAPALQTLLWLCEVLACAALLWSPLALACEPAALTARGGRRARMFPAAVRLLLQQPSWRPVRNKTCGWLQQLQEEPAIAELLRLHQLLPMLQTAS